MNVGEGKTEDPIQTFLSILLEKNSKEAVSYLKNYLKNKTKLSFWRKKCFEGWISAIDSNNYENFLNNLIRKISSDNDGNLLTELKNYLSFFRKIYREKYAIDKNFLNFYNQYIKSWIKLLNYLERYVKNS